MKILVQWEEDLALATSANRQLQQEGLQGMNRTFCLKCVAGKDRPCFMLVTPRKNAVVKSESLHIC